MSLSVGSAATNALAALQSLAVQTAAGGPGQETSSAASASSSSAASSYSVSTSSFSATSGLHALVEGVGQATTAADAASAAGQSVLALLQQLRQTAASATDPSLSSADRQALQADFKATTSQIDPTIGAATVGGVNLVDGSQTTGLKVALGAGGSASLTPLNLTLGGSTLSVAASASVATATAAASAFSTLGDAIGTASSALDTLSGQADQLSAHAGFVQTFSQALASPSDDGGDSVRLLALQLSQQLAGQTTAVATAAPQSILALFRS